MPTRQNRPVGIVMSEGEMAHRFRTMAANTTARGYGAPHAAERKRRLPLYTEHDPCGYCGRPLGPNRTAWHLPHNTTRTGYLPGFWHARCNIREAAIRGNQRQAARRTIRRAQSRTW